jgi:hypothetical protein
MKALKEILIVLTDIRSHLTELLEHIREMKK